MQRDMNLIREILLQVEAHPEPHQDMVPKVEGRSPAEIGYHCWLLHNAGLVVAREAASMSHIDWRPFRLTWAGHEFLNASRSGDGGRGKRKTVR